MYSFFDYLPHAQDGMEKVYVPRIEDFPDYNSYRAAMDQYTAMNGYDEYPQESDTTSQQGYGHMRWHPEWNDEEIIPQQAQMVAQAQTVQAQQPVTPTSAPIPTRPSYTGPSIVDYLGMNGKASDYNTRKLIAESMGIKNYRGRDYQNTELLKKLLDNPNGIDGYNYTVNARQCERVVLGFLGWDQQLYCFVRVGPLCRHRWPASSSRRGLDLGGYDSMQVRISIPCPWLDLRMGFPGRSGSRSGSQRCARHGPHSGGLVLDGDSWLQQRISGAFGGLVEAVLDGWNGGHPGWLPGAYERQSLVLPRCRIS